MDRFEVIESKHWVRDDGRTASIYGALPWVTEREKPRWKMVTRGYTVRDNERGTVGIGRQPWATRAEAQAWVDKETARLDEARRWHEANYPKKTSVPRGKRSHATKKSPAQLQREIDEVLANPGGASGAFDPPRTMNVVDRHGGFTAITRSGTLWRPGKAAPGGTFGSLVPGSVKRDDFYQNKQPVVSALYKLPSYGYKVKIWWEPSGERIA